MSRLSHKRGRKSNYVKELNSNNNQKEVRERVLLRDGFKCKVCPAIIRLETHHISYYVDGKSIIGHELKNDNLKWVVCLCENHHQEVHDNPRHKWNPCNPFKEPVI